MQNFEKYLFTVRDEGKFKIILFISVILEIF